MNSRQEMKIRELAINKAVIFCKRWNQGFVGGNDTIIHDGNVWTVDVEIHDLLPSTRWNTATKKHEFLHQTQDGTLKYMKDISVTVALDRPYVRTERDLNEESEYDDDKFWVDEEGNVCARQPEDGESEDDELITADEFLSEPIEQ